MAVTHHPDSQYLNDYAAGCLSVAQSLCVAVHLAYCAQCRAQLNQLTSIGGALMEQLAPTPVSTTLLDRVMTQIDERQHPPVSALRKVPAQPLIQTADDGPLPDVVSKLTRCDISTLRWRRLNKTMAFAQLATGDRRNEATLYNIRAGGSIPLHGHRGTEITVVLRGAFSDNAGVYHNGDFIVRGSDDNHAPTATLDDDCLCLAVLDQPVKFSGLMRVINPFIRIHPR
jgi:putative transcriptional regulator